MNRREHLKSYLAFVPMGIGFAGISFMGFKFISPSRKKQELRKIFAVNLDDLPVNSTKKFKDLRGKDLLIIRTQEREVKALSTVCTHLGCKVYWQKDKNRFFCPCHDGVFDPEGKVKSGPPPRDLDTYRVELDGDNVYIYSKEL